MRIFGLTITRTKANQNLSSVSDNRGWYRILESFSGAWQKNVTVSFNSVVAHHAVYACVTLIASDIAKLCVKLKELTPDGIWEEVTRAAYSPVLRKPNHYQNRIQFWENWIISKLLRGNTYVLKERDNRNVVTALYILDPCRVTPLVSNSGEIFYRLSQDNLSGIEEASIVVPASEIIHDRMNCIFHPLIGTSPILACGVAAMQGLAIQNNQTNFFNNLSMPGGILTAPGAISDETAARLKAAFQSNYSGENAGKIAVVGDGLKFEKLAMTAVESQVIDQLKFTGEVVCSTFHVPGYKVGIGTMPTANNVQSLNLEYYSQALQRLIEDAELCLDEGLGMGENIGTEFDTDNLLRMDTASMVTAESEAVGAGIKAPNEARKRFQLPPVAGGDSPYLQQQNYSLQALSKRDAQADPFGTAKTQTAALPPPASSAEPTKVLTLDFVKSRFTGHYEMKEAA